MIQPNELRIGNYLIDPKTSSWLMVIKVDVDDIATFVIDRSKYPLPKGWSIESIPLTLELFKKCNISLLKEIYSITPYFNRKMECCINFDNGGQLIITSLHQLQNLHFAFTGEELPITL